MLIADGKCRWLIQLHHVFKPIFGSTSIHKVNFFDILRSKKSELDLTVIDFSECNPVVDIWKNKAIENLQYLNSDERAYLPRDDFEELIKLSQLNLTDKVLVNLLFNAQKLSSVLGGCLHQFMHSKCIFCTIN